MADQYLVDLAAEPVAKSSTFALWVLTHDQIHDLLASSGYSWTKAASSKREVKEGTFHPTARARTAIPVPIRRFLEKFDGREEQGRVLYHGCGKDGHGLGALTRNGRDDVVGYDPYHPDVEFRKPPRGKFDEVFSIYTLNVVERGVGVGILAEIASLLKKGGRAVIAVRRDL